MPVIAQICMVVVTIASVAMAVLAVRLMLQTKALLETANRSLMEVPALIADAQRASARADELLSAFAQITRTAREGAARLEGLAERSTALASVVLDEVERPITRAVGVVRGLRSAANAIQSYWQSRHATRTSSQKEIDHDGEERWLDDGGTVPGGGGGSRSGAAVRADVR
jgi:biopolymer transport protein ExbB/TolQ